MTAPRMTYNVRPIKKERICLYWVERWRTKNNIQELKTIAHLVLELPCENDRKTLRQTQHLLIQLKCCQTHGKDVRNQRSQNQADI